MPESPVNVYASASTPHSPESFHKSIDNYISPMKSAAPHPAPDYYAHEPLHKVSPVKSPGKWEAETGPITARPDGPLAGKRLDATFDCAHVDVEDFPGLRKEWDALGGSPEYCLRMAASRGEMQLVRRCLRAPKIKIDSGDDNMRTAIHCASENGHLEVVRALVIAGADREAQDELGRTPIMSAAWFGHVAVIRYLARTAMVDIDAQAITGMTATHFAARYGHAPSVVALVKEFGANALITDEYGQLPVHYAMEENQKEVVALLS